MNVSAVIVTRGDVDLTPILYSFDGCGFANIVVWDNGKGSVIEWRPDRTAVILPEQQDVSVYGRYAAIPHALGDLIYVQDDDCLLPRESIEAIIWQSDSGSAEYGGLVCNMPANFRHSFYQEHALVGFGACFHRNLPEKAFSRFFGSDTGNLITRDLLHYYRTCDIVFTGLTPYTLVDVPYEDLPWATADNRMWKQPTHREERGKMLELVKKVRDAGP